jgi:hypothetical protein
MSGALPPAVIILISKYRVRVYLRGAWIQLRDENGENNRKLGSNDIITFYWFDAYFQPQLMLKHCGYVPNRTNHNVNSAITVFIAGFEVR